MNNKREEVHSSHRQHAWVTVHCSDYTVCGQNLAVFSDCATAGRVGYASPLQAVLDMLHVDRSRNCCQWSVLERDVVHW